LGGRDDGGCPAAKFEALYSRFGRQSIPPERLLRALLLQAFYTIRSERQLVKRIEFDLLFRWFVGLGVDDSVWDARECQILCVSVVRGLLHVVR
jgi:transposase